MVEEWKPVVGFEGYYEVSDLGKVRSLDRTVPCKKSGVSKRKGKLLNIYLRKEYLAAALSKGGKGKAKFVHRLVAESFIPNPLGKPCVNHEDGNKLNNNKTNLSWCTYSENTYHAYRTGLIPNGENKKSAKLTQLQVMEICQLLDNTTLTQYEIADRFGVLPPAISRINTGDKWNHITSRKGKVLPNNLLGGNSPKSKAVINCRGDEFCSIIEASVKYGIHYSGIVKSCTGKISSAGRYSDGHSVKWSYL